LQKDNFCLAQGAGAVIKKGKGFHRPWDCLYWVGQ
jgi:hypothetical protein